jgi:hypothetical protein
MNIDLEKAHKAMQSFTTADGKKHLHELSNYIDQFRKGIPVDLNDAEYDYVVRALVNQRHSTDRSANDGFVIKSQIK